MSEEWSTNYWLEMAKEQIMKRTEEYHERELHAGRTQRWGDAEYYKGFNHGLLAAAFEVQEVQKREYEQTAKVGEVR